MRNVTREEAVELLRSALVDMVDDRRSLCQVASERGIFCRGFSQWTFPELRERFPWIARLEPDLDRERFEKRANQWMLHRQFCKSGRLPCDVPAEARRCKPCHGWDEFYEAELAAFCSEICGEQVRVVPESMIRSSPARAAST
jgi:hypothetical protein